MATKTRLQIFIELLSGREAPADARALRDLAREHARTLREREVAAYLRHLPTAGLFYDALAEGTDWRALAALLEEHRAGRWRVAAYAGERNLLNVAMRLGFDVYVARSARGAVVKARRGLRVDAARLPGDARKQVYPDLAVWTGDPAAAPAPEAVLAVLAEAVA